MIVDTIVVVLMFVSSAQQIQMNNRFSESFRKADCKFEQQYRMKERLDSVSHVTVREAAEKTREAREKAIGDLYLWRRKIEKNLRMKWK